MNEQSSLKVCVDRIIPDSAQPARAMSRMARVTTALYGTGLNTPRELFHDIDPTKDIQPERMALVDGKKWPISSEVKCRFLGGSNVQQEKAIKMASEWMEYANIKLSFVDTQDEQIRIAFMPGQGSWSAVGTDVLDPYYPKTQATMNFGWLDETTDDTEWRRVVVHEFGHALGCIHEHQSPNEHLHWDREAVYKRFMGPPNNWTKDEIDSNILEKYSPKGMSATIFDPKSIMLYMFPPELFTDHKGTPNNTDLSSKDKAFIKKMYPK
jgi:hypothetical protein